MDENVKEISQENKVETTTANDENSNNGKHELDVIAEAKKINEELKKENDRRQKLIEREEKILARQETLKALGGGSPSGIPKPEPKVETAEEYAKRVMQGKI